MLKRLLIMTLTLCVLLSAAPALAGEADEELLLGPFSAENLNGGGTVTEAVFAEASITLVNLWTTTCGYCIGELPDLQRLSEMTGGKVRVVSVLLDSVGMDGLRDESAVAAMETLIAGAEATFPVLAPDALFLALGGMIQGVPTTLLVDARGVILSVQVGARSAEAWLQIAQTVANEAYEGGVTLAE